MKMICKSSFAKKLLNDQSGQVLIWVTLGFLSLIAVAGLVIDGGQAYADHAILQNSANAAALAAAGEVYNSNSTTGAVAFGTTYSGSSGDSNANANMPGAGTVSTSLVPVCLNALLPSGITCAQQTTGFVNAVHAYQTNTINTFFMRFFGKPQMIIKAEATASMQGQSQPWNIAIVLDSTGSMTLADSNCGSGMTEFTCATQAIRAFLGGASPCKTGYTSCATSNANLHVALFSFPAVSTGTVIDETSNCRTPTFMGYPLPPASATSYSPASFKVTSTSSSVTVTPTYEVVPFSSDYYSATASNHLNSSSALANTVSNCIAAMPLGNQNTALGGITDPTCCNAGLTYLAAPIYAAQAALVAQQAANPGTKNAIIFLSDGQANMNETNDFLVGSNVTLSTTSPGSGAITTFTGTGKYPDISDQCQQAIIAAQQAAAAGTRVYSVSYGAETDGCTSTTGTGGSEWSYGTDNSTLTLPATANAPFTAATLRPCQTMENIANAEAGSLTSSLNYFYSDYNQTNSGTGPDVNCIDQSHSVSSLNAILLAILGDFTSPRLLPNSLT